MPTLQKKYFVKTPPRPYDFSSNETPDSKAIEAIRYGKSYKAAADLVGFTISQVGGRLTWLRKNGIQISAKMWRESSMKADERKIRELERRFRYCQSILNDAKRIARRATNQKKKYRRK